jgi:hypothetical protein
MAVCAQGLFHPNLKPTCRQPGYQQVLCVNNTCCRYYPELRHAMSKASAAMSAPGAPQRFIASVSQALGIGSQAKPEQQQQQQQQQQQEASMEDEWVRSYEQRESARTWYEQQQDTYRARSSRYSSDDGQQQQYQRTAGGSGGGRASGPGTSPPDNGGFPPGYDHYQVLGVTRGASLVDIQVSPHPMLQASVEHCYSLGSQKGAVDACSGPDIYVCAVRCGAPQQAHMTAHEQLRWLPHT